MENLTGPRDKRGDITIAILGASGYTGAELLRLLHSHPHVRVAALTGESQAGKPLGEVYPHLAHLGLPALLRHEQVDFSAINLVFCCLPHGTTQPIIAALPDHVRIIDLSADFRLHDVAEYAQWYGHAHQAPALQKQAVYGLTEHVREAVKQARLVANPGCYPTASLLPLLPLLKAGTLRGEGIIIDAKSGITGAGRSAKQSNLFAEINEGISAYGIASHRHVPEIEQALAAVCAEKPTISFTPHLMPMNRGMLATIYATLAPGQTYADARHVLETAYRAEPFVQILPPGILPTTHQVRASNRCVINLFESRQPGQLILVSAIDNLTKGASGQAVQNMNVMFGWPETTGLEQPAVFP
jgi:N-acetyl-gamma-glutamyl-phosphate reductase